jgi:hypothetical protein
MSDNLFEMFASVFAKGADRGILDGDRPLLRLAGG